jgi:twitching motility two-component system response regulator PilH
MSKILIVDDSSAELASLRALLDKNGWHSVTATSGAEGVQKAISEKPNLILMDVVMPDMDGYEACRLLQADASTKGIPVVFVTSKCQKADHMWAKMQGGKALIAKPYQPQEILDAIKAYA